jgi:hypothetical protein
MPGWATHPYENLDYHRCNAGSCGTLGISVFFKTFEELGVRLRDESQMARIREKVWTQRELFTFDYHADRLIEFFRKVIRE